MTDLREVSTLQINMRGSLGTDPGKEVMKFLEQLCGWYDFGATDTNEILIGHGRRQVLATIKTLLECTPEQIVATTMEQQNG